MTGPEHYRRAEALLADVVDPRWGREDYPGGLDGVTHTVALAQAHATLALAAAAYDQVLLAGGGS